MVNRCAVCDSFFKNLSISSYSASFLVSRRMSASHQAVLTRNIGDERREIDNVMNIHSSSRRCSDSERLLDFLRSLRELVQPLPNRHFSGVIVFGSIMVLFDSVYLGMTIVTTDTLPNEGMDAKLLARI
jgi:hypothetical protein